MQRKEQINPLFLNTDISYEEMLPTMSPFIKGLTWDINSNPVSGIGTSNPTGEGQNMLVRTPTRSNIEIPTTLPVGYNKNIGAYESETTHELYYFNFNINGNHGIYVLDGDTSVWNAVVIDSQLLFTDDAENFPANHRVTLRFVKDKSNKIIEKYLIITEGGSWQKYINVIAAIKTNGFDASLFPYWNLKQPHFDRRELLEWPVRPPMVKPIPVPIANTSADKGKLNRFIDKGFQVAIAYQNTDGRTTTLSPYSLPILIKSEDFLNNPDNIPKNVKVTMRAGSPLTEKILFYVRQAKVGTNTLPEIVNWSDWSLYDTIKKFPNSNSSDVLGTDYWLRTNPFAGLNYNGIFNTIDYVFDLSKVPQIINQEDANMIQTGMPQLSVALCDLGDNILLADNRYGYPNFDDTIINEFSVVPVEKQSTSCPIPLRKVRLYAYIGMCGDDFAYTSQVGYFNGADTQMRFGGLRQGATNVIDINVAESKNFNLDFADKEAFRCYLKGTPYYSDGTWYQVNSDNSKVKLPSLLDFSSIEVQEAQQTFLLNQGYYVCVFDFDVPAGQYIATIGRHNVPSAGDYRNTSTYLYGIANSRVKSQTTIHHVDSGGFPIGSTTLTSIKPNAINNGNGILYSKEMEIDCTSADVDVWGNNHDLFYIYCPYITKRGNLAYRFIEGYFKEILTNPLPIEMFAYQMNHNAMDDWGKFTDKNGFYWAYTKVDNSSSVDIQFACKLNCAYPTYFTIPTSSSGIGWKQNADSYLADNNGGIVGVANRIIMTGKITSLDGSLTYSNIAISIKDGATVYTASDGTFTLIIHNGTNVLRTSNVYVNAGSNFNITIAGCGQIPLFNFNEALAPCVFPSTTPRTYPIQLLLGVQISTDSQMSVKEGGKYNVVAYGGDLAGRIMYANVLSETPIPSFLERDDLNAMFLRLILNNVDLSGYEDMKWLFVGVSKNVNIKRFVQWVGDEIDFIDNSGNTVTDPSSAVFASIKINSLYNSNLAKNFSLLSSYEFVKEDRLRILDDGNGNLFDVATYGDPIDLQILGTNYIQAAISSGLLPPQSNTVLPSTTVTTPDVTLIVRYDTRLNKLINDKGFWIEIYTPTQQSDIIPFYESFSCPIINGKPAEFTGFNSGVPAYTYLTTIDLDFWDTYFFDRSITIPNVGNKNFGHPFESPNVTDNWGADVISGGRNNIKNDNAKQFWLGGETIKSDSFLKEGLVNGLATFRSGNKKDFGIYPFGSITAMHSERNLIAVICENDWFTIDYDYHYAFLNEQGIMEGNLNDGLSTPHQKMGSKFGMSKGNTRTFQFLDKEIYWYDKKNMAWVRCNYKDAVDTTFKTDTEQGGMHSYFNTKTDFITAWNNSHDKDNSFDVVSGVDIELGKMYITFRCRRHNSNELSSYINNRRNWQLNYQETVVYDTKLNGWLRTEGFTPEGYGSIRGDAGTQLISFSAGKPYSHNIGNTSFNMFYTIQTTPVLMGVFNVQKDIVKIFEALSDSSNPSGWFVDLLFTNFKNSLSYLSSNQYYLFFGNYYAAIMRNMNSYPSNDPTQLFRSMLFDGYRMVGRYLVMRMVGNYDSLNTYKELGIISCLLTMDDTNTKAEPIAK